MAKRILLICYYFPPMGGAGIGRPLTLYKYLSQHDCDCDVLTVKPVAYRLHEPELLEDVDTRGIYRAGSWDPQRLMHLVGLRRVKDSTISKGKKVSDRFFPDPKIGWVRSAVKLGRVLAENRHYDCVLSTSPPISSHLVARKLAEEFKLPWVADFRDFWTGYKAEEWFADPRQIDRAKALLVDICDKASVVTVTNPAIGEYLGRGEVIYNSFDETRVRLWKAPPREEQFAIGVLGTIDELRPIEPLLKLLRHLKETNAEVYRKVKVIQVGAVNLEGLAAQLEGYGLTDRFEMHGVQKREKTIEILSATSMLYIALAPPHGKGVLPGRLFDMLASGRPVLAAVETDGVVAAIVKDTPYGICFDDSSLKVASGQLIALIETLDRGESAITPNPEYARGFSSAAMVKSFVEIFEKTTTPGQSSDQ